MTQVNLPEGSQWMNPKENEFVIEASMLEAISVAPVCPICNEPIVRLPYLVVRATPHVLFAERNKEDEVTCWVGHCTRGAKLVVFND